MSKAEDLKKKLLAAKTKKTEPSDSVTDPVTGTAEIVTKEETFVDSNGVTKRKFRIPESSRKRMAKIKKARNPATRRVKRYV